MAREGFDQGGQRLQVMSLVGLSSRQRGDALRMNLPSRVVGAVGHATQRNVRGNTCAADLTLAPVDGAWEMIAFDLTDVDRTDAGGLVAPK